MATDFNDLAWKDIKMADPQNMTIGALPAKVTRNGLTAELRQSTKTFKCIESGKPIRRGEYYYSIYYHGAGVQVRPPRVRPEYLERLFSEHDENGYRQVFPWLNK